MSEPGTTDPIAKVLQDRKLDNEDFIIQIDAATLSMLRGNYATARAELRGAMLILDKMESRRG